MGSFGQVSLKDVWSMLEACAPGYKVKGGHGATNPPIQARHVRKMARFLGILDCARRELPVLGNGRR